MVAMSCGNFVICCCALKVIVRFHNFVINSHLSTLMQLLFSFDQDMKVEKTLIQTLACQLSSTLMQPLFLLDQVLRVEKTLMQTLVCHARKMLFV